MTARLRPFALVNSNEIASPFVDGFTVVSASTPERLALVQRWQAEQGPTVAVIDGSDLPKQHQPAASATDVLRRELAIAEAQEALAAAELKHREALEGVSRREQASHAALAALATPAPEPPQVDTLGLEAKIDQLSNAATQGALVLARLQDEVAYDLSQTYFITQSQEGCVIGETFTGFEPLGASVGGGSPGRPRCARPPRECRLPESHLRRRDRTRGHRSGSHGAGRHAALRR